MSHERRWLLAISGLLIGTVQAEFHPEALEAAYFEELPTVVVAGRLEQPLTTVPASVTVIDREMIEASGRTSLPDLMRLAAGFQVGHQGGFWVGVTRHGISEEFARRLQVLVDGRTVYLPGTGGVDWHDLPLALEDIERIEITRGPNGASYGANAYLGTIHIHTREPGQEPGTRVRTEAGEQGYRRTLVSHERAGLASGQRLSWQYQEDDGYFGSSGARHDQQRHRINYRGQLHTGVNSQVDAMAGLTAGEWGTGSSEDPIRPERAAEVERYFGQLAWQGLRSTREEFRARLHYERSDTRLLATTQLLSDIVEQDPADVAALLGRDDGTLELDESRDMRRLEAEFEHHLQPFDALRLLWGLQSRQDEMVAPGYLNSEETHRLTHNRLFAHAEWRVASAWTLHGGAGLERESYSGTHLAPRAAVNWHVHDDHAVRLGATRAWRTPGFVESEAEWGYRFSDDGSPLSIIALGNDELEPERIDSLELALVGQTRRLNYEVKLFEQRLSDVITGVRNEDAEPPQGDPMLCDLQATICHQLELENDGEMTQRGLEVQLDWRPGESTRLGLGYAHVRSRGHLTEKVVDGERQGWKAAELTPEHTLAALVSQRWGYWHAGFTLYHMSTMDWISNSDPVAFTTADLSLGRAVPATWGEGEVKLVVLDAPGRYATFRPSYEHDRRAYLRLGLSF